MLTLLHHNVSLPNIQGWILSSQNHSKRYFRFVFVYSQPCVPKESDACIPLSTVHTCVKEELSISNQTLKLPPLIFQESKSACTFRFLLIFKVSKNIYCKGLLTKLLCLSSLTGRWPSGCFMVCLRDCFKRLPNLCSTIDRWLQAQAQCGRVWRHAYKDNATKL